MGTRALIGYLDTNQTPAKLTTTYNQYDGYPENLGKGLEDFYDNDAKAKEIASVGYISSLDSETGEWENTSNSTSPADVIQLPNNFNEAMKEIAYEIEDFGANYGYIWDNENGEWITIRNITIKGMYRDLEMDLAHLKDKFEMFSERPSHYVDNDEADEDARLSRMNEKGMKEAKEGEYDESVLNAMISDMLKYKSYDEVLQTLKQMVINAENEETKTKKELEEHIKRQWQYRAGIIK